jgi:hypothetical protein
MKKQIKKYDMPVKAGLFAFPFAESQIEKRATSVKQRWTH